MKKLHVKRLLRWMLCMLTLVTLLYISSRLFISQSQIVKDEEKYTKYVVKGDINDTIRDVYLTQAVLSIQAQTLEAGIHEKIQFPPFVDSKDPMGPGEGGVAVNVSKLNVSSQDYKDGWYQHRFNEVVSKMISVHRSIPDNRSDECKQHVQNFTGTLPELSVVVIFHNEAWTTLLRSVHSILDRTPDHLLKEIILVDDNSTLDHLRAPLDKYFSSFPKVRIIHSTKRVGLTTARLIGFEASVAPVVVFFDSHIECFPGWAESILIRIINNPNAVVFPEIPNISSETFEVYHHKKVYYYGTFDWKNLMFNWISIPKREHERRKNDADHYRSPVMPGGLFAISREFFTKLGTYDPSFGFWGGENIELSFKTWMCGGSLEMDVCSQVGHVFRHAPPRSGDSMTYRNSIRVAEVWMDDYKNYFYELNNYKLDNPGNVTDRILLRRSLDCKSFEWYLKNVFPEKTFPHSMKYAGEIRNTADSKCIDGMEGREHTPLLKHCSGKGQSQVWYMGVTGQIQQSDVSICVHLGKVFIKTECNPTGPHWQFREDKSLYHIPTGQCLTADSVNDTVKVTPCSNSTQQKWTFQLRRTDLNFPKYS